MSPAIALSIRPVAILQVVQEPPDARAPAEERRELACDSAPTHLRVHVSTREKGWEVTATQ